MAVLRKEKPTIFESLYLLTCTKYYQYKIRITWFYNVDDIVIFNYLAYTDIGITTAPSSSMQRKRVTGASSYKLEKRKSSTGAYEWRILQAFKRAFGVVTVILNNSCGCAGAAKVQPGHSVPSPDCWRRMTARRPVSTCDVTPPKVRWGTARKILN